MRADLIVQCAASHASESNLLPGSSREAVLAPGCQLVGNFGMIPCHHSRLEQEPYSYKLIGTFPKIHMPVALSFYRSLNQICLVISSSFAFR